MKKHQFNTFWHGSELSPIEWACLSSFAEHGHNVRLFCYDPIRVPKGVSLADASEIISKDEIVLLDAEFGQSLLDSLKAGRLSAFSDLFRYEMISKLGEWWIDADVYCLRDDIPDCKFAWAREDVDKVNGAVLKFPSHEPLLNTISSDARRIGPNVTVWAQLGPDLLTKYLSEHHVDGHFGTQAEFYPIHWLETFLFWLPNYGGVIEEKCKEAYFLHLWTSIFRLMKVDVYTRPPSGSFLEKLYAPHVGEFRLKELSPQRYNQSIEGIKSFCKDMVSVSERLVGYDTATFPFENIPYSLNQLSPSSVEENL